MKTFFLFFLLFLASCQKENLELPEQKFVRCATDLPNTDSLFGSTNQQYLKLRELPTSQLKYDGPLPATQFPAGITIPVIVHVIHNVASGAQIGTNIPDARIYEQIDILNKDFARLNSDTGNVPLPFKSLVGNPMIQFCLATRDTFGNPTTGIIRKYSTTTSWSPNGAMKLNSYGGSDAWDSKLYLNIWICNLQGALGYAIYPIYGNPQSDGIVLRYNVVGLNPTYSQYALGRTATHEVGHWLGLYHVGGWSCGDDLISDTPLQLQQNYNCQVFPKISCSNAPFGEMFMNFLDNTYDYCLSMFTKLQCDRMRYILFKEPRGRLELRYSKGCR